MSASKKQKVDIFDTTLRDGEQAAGSRLGVREKLEIAGQLERLGVDIIEAGFPVSSPKDFEAVELLSQEITGPTICALSRAVTADIDACGKALAKAKKSRITTSARQSRYFPQQPALLLEELSRQHRLSLPEVPQD